MTSNDWKAVIWSKAKISNVKTKKGDNLKWLYYWSRVFSVKTYEYEKVYLFKKKISYQLDQS